jgi:hypothetical protein
MAFPLGASTASSPDIREREEPLDAAEKARRERRLSQQLFGRAKPKPSSTGLLGVPTGSKKRPKRLSSLLFSSYGMVDTEKNGDQTGNETEPEPEERSPWGEGLEVAKEASGGEYCKAGSLGKIVEYLLKKTNGSSHPPVPFTPHHENLIIFTRRSVRD